MNINGKENQMSEAKDRKGTVKVELFDLMLRHGGNDKHEIPKAAPFSSTVRRNDE